jgi:hypothetical protein
MEVTSRYTDDFETKALVIAREIAMGLHDVETILKTHRIDPQTWADLAANKCFQDLVVSQSAAWQGALNTHERTKLKAAALIEEWLGEANARIHDQDETLSSKVELGKLLTRIAGMGITNMHEAGGSGEKFSITINLGADHKVSFDKVVTHKVIEGEKVEQS